MTARSQKLALLAHITFSMGWFGAVVPYVALAVAALTSHDEQKVRSAVLSMELIGWFVIVPFSLAALASGLVQSLGTRWGLLRHWWIVAKLVFTIFAVAVLLQHMRDVSRLSLMAKQAVVSSADLRPELIHSAGGLLVLFVVMALSVFRPWGRTPYGNREMVRAEFAPDSEVLPARTGVAHQGHQLSWTRIIGYHVVGLSVLLVMRHLSGLPHH